MICAERTTRMFCVGANVINYNVFFLSMITICHTSIHIWSSGQAIICFISQFGVNVFLCHWLKSNNILRGYLEICRQIVSAKVSPYTTYTTPRRTSPGTAQSGRMMLKKKKKKKMCKMTLQRISRLVRSRGRSDLETMGWRPVVRSL